MANKLILLLISIGLVINSCQGITKSDLFPFGEPDDKILTGSDEGASQSIQLSSPIILFGRAYDSLYVSINGIISFLADSANYLNYPLPLSIPMIAPFYADIDTRTTGKVYYRQTSNPEQLTLANSYINSVFTSGLNFQARNLVIVTWLDVGRYRKNLSSIDENAELKNTFQTVIATNGQETYAFFMYPQKGITWCKSDDKESRESALAQVGFTDFNGYKFYPLEVSGTSKTLNLDKMSNIRERGVFIFRIGKAGLSGSVVEPDRPASPREMETGLSEVPDRCETTFDPCPQEADCEQYSIGFCCKCKEGYIGNGRQCIKLESSPVRLVGQVHGTLNDQNIGTADIYVYADGNSGQIYTTISRLQNMQPSDFQSLISLTDLIGWLFARGQPGTVNGFSLTGGVFNRTARITFPSSGEQVTLTERYLGPDVYGNLKMDIGLTGNLPAIPMGSKVDFDDTIEVYTITAPGSIVSSSTRSYKLAGGSAMDIPITIEQDISYYSCAYLPKEQYVDTIKISAQKYNVDVRTISDPIRFTAEYSVVPPIDNPCKAETAVCGPDSRCVVDGERYRCVCNPGFQSNSESDPNSIRAMCVDINECTTNQSRCHKDANCVNQPGSYRCICNEGFVGDGYRCRSKDSMCGDKFCDPNADCLPNADGSKRCICQPGYSGSGIVCRSILGQPGSGNSCPLGLQCDRNANCAIHPVTKEYSCVCNPGFTGNGLVCESAGKVCSSDANCGENGQCKTGYSEAGVGYCVCKQGYYGDGFTCIRSTGPRVTENCFTSKICDTNAVCSDLPNGETKCICNEGYTGDGKTCTIISDCKMDTDCPASAKCDPLPEIVDGGKCTCIQGFVMIENNCVSNDKAPCNLVKNCHSDATCKFNLDERQFKCACNKGFKGDGKNCESIQVPCNVLNTCGSKADCNYNPIELGYRCTCRAGYSGDGYTCVPSSSCRENPYQCHRDAECVFSPTTRAYQCKCNNGFAGDGLDCLPSNRYDGPYLIATQGMSFARLPTSPGRQGELLFVLNNNLPVGIAFDCLKGSLYYTDLIDKAISKAGLNSTHDTTIVSGLSSPEGLAIDWISRNIYWTDSLKKTIQVSRLNGSFVKTLISDGLTNPRGIALHPGLGKMYFTDWNRAAPKIEMANMDGTNRQVLVSEGIGLPNMLAIDYTTNELCWTDAGAKRIECIDLYGSKRRLVHTFTTGYPFDLAVVDNYIFWTDWETNNVHRVGINGGKEETLMIPKGSNGRLHGLTGMSEACPAMGNQCRVRNGGCKFLCLPSGPRSRTCTCPDDDGSGEECSPFVIPPTGQQQQGQSTPNEVAPISY